jgi:hypothetical protein
MSELAFDKKPHRMTDPPQNQRKWLPGYEGVEVKLETDPRRVAYFAREATWGDIMCEPTEKEFKATLAEVAEGKVLSAAKRGPGFGFRIRASRSTMDQMLRLAEGSGGAGSGAGAQTTRDNDQRDFNIIVPNTIERMQRPPFDAGSLGEDRSGLRERVQDFIEDCRDLYGELVDAGVPPQDARYVALPLGFQTQWMHVMDLRALEKLCEQRLCNGLTQHETNYLVRLMRDEVVRLYPEFDKMLRSGCEKQGRCVSRSMLFPPCGAFSGPGISDTRPSERPQDDPDRYLYSAAQNDAMQFADWDWIRKGWEKGERSGIVAGLPLDRLLPLSFVADEDGNPSVLVAPNE